MPSLTRSRPHTRRSALTRPVSRSRLSGDVHAPALAPAPAEVSLAALQTTHPGELPRVRDLSAPAAFAFLPPLRLGPPAPSPHRPLS
jgi:hypothetical protein